MKRLVVAVTAIALLTSGCTFLQLVGLDPHAVPIQGEVTFHDTGIGLKAVVTVSAPVTTSSTGRFVMSLVPGNTYRWQAESLVGSASGSFHAMAGAPLHIRIPPFEGWDARHFNEVAVDASRRVTFRWPDGASIPYWLEQGDPAVVPEYHRLAEDALREWQQVLQNTIRFVPVANRTDAANGLVILWEDLRDDPRDDFTTDPYHGVCERTVDLSSGRILRGTIRIDYQAAHNAGLYRHEIGHCIGLNHSSNPGFLMYRVVGSWNQTMTVTEQWLARLLYAAAPKTPALPGAAVHISGAVRTVDEAENLITQTLY